MWLHFHLSIHRSIYSFFIKISIIYKQCNKYYHSLNINTLFYFFILIWCEDVLTWHVNNVTTSKKPLKIGFIVFIQNIIFFLLLILLSNPTQTCFWQVLWGSPTCNLKLSLIFCHVYLYLPVSHFSVHLFTQLLQEPKSKSLCSHFCSIHRDSCKQTKH